MFKKALILGMIAAVTISGSNGKTKETDNFYAKAGRVIEIDKVEDVVTVVDGADLTWQFYGVEDWQLGDIVQMLMDDNGTESTIYDDIIVRATYAGEI